MRHRVKKKKLGRLTKHRQAMLKNMVRSLIMYGKIETTRAKAKEVGRLTDKIISTAKKGGIAAKRDLHRFFGKRDIANTLVERIAPLMEDRDSGFTAIKVVGKRRGDNSLIAKLSLVKQPEEIGTLKRQDKGKK